MSAPPVTVTADQHLPVPYARPAETGHWLAYYRGMNYHGTIVW